MSKKKKNILITLAVSSLMLLYYIVYFGFLLSLLNGFWRYALGVIPLVFTAVTIAVCIERIREIKKGETDDLSQY